MKRILITGQNSYIGQSVEKWLINLEEYEVDTIDLKDERWKSYNFEEYNVVFHVAGIAHKKNVSSELYENVNHKLAVEVAKKAIDSGVEQFIFMSSGAIYTQSDRKHMCISVDSNSDANPVTEYGKSKLKAEKDILELKNNTMKIAILRPPTVYGKGAKGNYNAMAEYAKKIPLFPYVNNRRSMIYIENLCAFVQLIIDNDACGIFLPQNAEYVNTSMMVKSIANISGKKMHLIKGFGCLVKIAGFMWNPINKVFGSFYYDEASNKYFDGKYQVFNFMESIQKTEE